LIIIQILLFISSIDLYLYLAFPASFFYFSFYYVGSSPFAYIFLWDSCCFNCWKVQKWLDSSYWWSIPLHL